MAIAKIKFISIGTAIIFLGLVMPAFGQLTAQDASNMWNNFNASFYLFGGYYAWQQSGSYNSNDRWENAEMIEMATDCYIATPTSANETTLANLVNGFNTSYGSDWTSDKYNDDIMWSVLVNARAYLAIYSETKTVTSSMRNWALNASNNFCWVYNGGHSPNRVNPQYDNTFGGGMWWTNNSNPSTSPKNSCVNGPGALAAFYLSLIYPNAGFFAKGTNMINWETTYLVQPNGFLYDHYIASGPVGSDLSYNAGTYVGAAGFLGVGIQPWPITTRTMIVPTTSFPTTALAEETTMASTASSSVGWGHMSSCPATPTGMGSLTTRRTLLGRSQMLPVYPGMIGWPPRLPAACIAGIVLPPL